MKIMCLADLHWNEHRDGHTAFLIDTLRGDVASEDPDLILIAGDILEGDAERSPYKLLHSIFEGIPVVCVLGNHEFFFHTLEEVHKKHKDMYRPDKYNVHYLNVIGHYDMGNVRIFGDTLWYDGSMITRPNQRMYDFAHGRWADSYIKDFNYKEANEKCVDFIKGNMSEDKTGILLTHHVPHKDLNGHVHPIGSEFDAYSGMADFLKEITAEYAVCGHTHKRVCKMIDDIKCVNVGNDYFQTQYEIIKF